MNLGPIFRRLLPGCKGATNEWSYEAAAATWLDERPIPSRADVDGEIGRLELDLERDRASADVQEAFRRQIAGGCGTTQFSFTLSFEMSDIDQYDKAIRLAQRLGRERTMITDHAGELHEVAIAELDTAVTELGVAYSALWVHREECLSQIRSAESVDQVRAIRFA